MYVHVAVCYYISRIHFCFVQKSLKLRPGISAEPKSCILNLSTSQLREAAGNCQRSWAASSNQSQKGSRRRVPPQDDSRILRSWSKKCRFSGFSRFSRFNLWSTLTPEEFDVKTLISWLASPLAHWDSNCPIETWHKSVLSTLKTC